LFKDEFCSPFKLSQWKHQLRNRKQKPGETVEEYVAAIEELWKRIDPARNRTELDRIYEFIEGLRSEFIVPVQSSMPNSVDEAITKARAVETAFSIGMELSAYSMLPNYLESNRGFTVPAKTNLAVYQPSYLAGNNLGAHESVEQIVERKIKEGITAALGQLREPSNNTGRHSNVKCYNCNRFGHYAKDCRQRNNGNNGNNRNINNNESIECFKCGRKGHISRNCRVNQGNRNNNRNRSNGNYGGSNYSQDLN
jgi:hypothetical protein